MEPVPQPSATSFSSSRTLDESWSVTRMKVIQFSHKWIVDNFSYCHQAIGESLRSPTFSSFHSPDQKWCLDLYPHGLNEDDKDYISLFLMLASYPKKEVHAKYALSIQNSSNEKFTVMIKENQPVKFVENDMEESWGRNRCIKRNVLMDPANGFLPDDKLTIVCEVSVVCDTEDVHGASVLIDIPTSSLGTDLSTLLSNDELSDLALVVKGTQFQAHKAILAVRSPVFYAMFKHEMKEKRHNVVIIEDIEPTIMRELLSYIYSDTCPNLETLAVDILPAADKYDLQRLKAMCEKELCSKITVSNAAELVKLADTHNAAHLKAYTSEFIITHSNEILESVSLPQLLVGTEVKTEAVEVEQQPEQSEHDTEQSTIGPSPIRRQRRAAKK